MPTGQITAFAGATAPEGWLLCEGSAVSRSTYAELFAVIGTTYGNGDGSTTFNLPDLRQRFPLGKAAAGTGAALGARGGAIDHVHGLDTASSHAKIQQSILAGTSIRSRRRSGVTSYEATQGTSNATSGNVELETTNGVELGGNSNSANPPFLALNMIIMARAVPVTEQGGSGGI